MLLEKKMIPKIYMKNVKEFLSLAWTNLLVAKRNFVEGVKVVVSYYSNLRFAKADALLTLTYLFDNPFTISKRFLAHRGENNLYQYGETPLTTFDEIIQRTGLTPNDNVMELGCGRGRTCFWLNQYVGCQVTGVEYIEDFVQRAQHVQKKCQAKNLHFLCQDMLDIDLKGITYIYLYGSSLEDDYLLRLTKKLEELPVGAKVVTVSYPLTDYTSLDSFEVINCFPATFTWGEADVYLQIKK